MDRIGKYVIEGTLGAGGMGTVYRARDTLLERVVALKVLHEHFRLHPSFQERFRREARAGARLVHPNLCAIYELGEQDGVLYIAMEHLSGTNLAQRMKRGERFPPERVALIADQILQALECVHRMGHVHRDVKPANLMIGESDHVWLMDLGLVKRLAGDSMAVTGAGQFVGSPLYSSPEQFQGVPLTERTDLYSLGVVVYEMLSGKKAFAAETPTALVQAVTEGRRLPLSEAAPEAGSDLVQWTETLLAIDPTRRFSSAAAAREQLARAAAIEPPPAGFAAPPGMAAQDQSPPPQAPDPTTCEIRKETRPPPAPYKGSRLQIPSFDYGERNARGFDEYHHTKTGTVLVHVPAGEFLMGSGRGAEEESPEHLVELDAYLIGRCPVTNAQYRRFCIATAHDEPRPPTDGWGYKDYFSNPQFGEYPVVNVSWEDARAYCEWSGLDLPTEAQWEYAARGTDGRPYPWGSEEPDGTRANFGKEVGRGSYTRPGGWYGQGMSPFGLLDMVGNVCEWCADWYDARYYASCGDLVHNPPGPVAANPPLRAVRGGSWYHSVVVYLRTYHRVCAAPRYWSEYQGFRVAKRMRLRRATTQDGTRKDAAVE